MTRLFGMLLISALAIAPAHALAQTTVIHAGHLIAEPGHGVATDQSVVIEDGRIVSIRSGFVPGDVVIDLRDSWVMPGLIDMHTHITGVLNLAEPAAPQIAHAYMAPPARTVLSMLPTSRTLLMNGFTTIRSLGDQSLTQYALRDAINAGWAPGPRMFVAEAQIAVAGGDLDASQMDVRGELEPFVTNRGNCSGVVDCVRTVRTEIQRGADFIKLRQSGMAASDPEISMVETPEEIHAVIDTAHQLHRRVAAHVTGTPAYLHLVIEAGVDTIEHGPLDDESIALMRRHGTAYTPTLLAAKMIDYRYEEASEFTGRAYRAGVPIIFGTDLGIFGAERSHEEFGLLAQAGLPPEQVLRAATVNAAEALGQGSALGKIAPGFTADIVAMRIDPLVHIEQLGAPDRMTFVMKDGEVFKEMPAEPE